MSIRKDGLENQTWTHGEWETNVVIQINGTVIVPYTILQQIMKDAGWAQRQDTNG